MYVYVCARKRERKCHEWEQDQVTHSKMATEVGVCVCVCVCVRACVRTKVASQVIYVYIPRKRGTDSSCFSESKNSLQKETVIQSTLGT